MVGGLYRGLSNENAMRFAFPLSTPVILAAGALKRAPTYSDHSAMASEPRSSRGAQPRWRLQSWRSCSCLVTQDAHAGALRGLFRRVQARFADPVRGVLT